MFDCHNHKHNTLCQQRWQGRGGGGEFDTVHKLQCTTSISANKPSPQFSKPSLHSRSRQLPKAVLCPASAFCPSPESPEQVRTVSYGKNCLQAHCYSPVTVIYWSMWLQPGKHRPFRTHLERPLRYPVFS